MWARNGIWILLGAKHTVVAAAKVSNSVGLPWTRLDQGEVLLRPGSVRCAGSSARVHLSFRKTEVGDVKTFYDFLWLSMTLWLRFSVPFQIQVSDSANLADLPADHEAYDTGRGPGARQLRCQLRGDALAASPRGAFGTRDARRSLSNLDESFWSQICSLQIAPHTIAQTHNTSR